MEYFWALIVGITSSLIATATFVVLFELTRRVFLPWYADRIYRGVRLDGKWQMRRYKGKELDLETVPANELQLRQKGDEVTGTTIIQGQDEPEATVYKVRGQIRDGYFNATLWPVAPDMVDAGTCLFRVFHADKKLRMKGLHTYVNSRDGAVNAAPGEVEYCKTNS